VTTSKKPPRPTKQQIIDFVATSAKNISKREIARAFHLTGNDRIWLKAVLKEMAAESLIQKGRKKNIRPTNQLPRVLLCTVLEKLNDEGEVLLSPPDEYEDARPIILEKARTAKIDPGTRMLVRLKLIEGSFYLATFLKKITDRAQQIVGMIEKTPRGFIFKSSDRRDKKQYIMQKLPADAQSGDFVVARIQYDNRTHIRTADFVKPLGHKNDPKTISLIAIHDHDIPHDWPKDVLHESTRSAERPFVHQSGREDLTAIPLVTIDGEDARDFDDAVFAEFDEEKQSYHLIVAIADVSHYVTPGSLLDHEAYKRGNSVYFPDRVVPMLPEILSNDLCSLRPKVKRAALAVHMWLDKTGRLKKYTFVRAVIKSAARLTYNQVQAAMDGKPDGETKPLIDSIIKPLYGAYELLKKAREFRGTLELDLPEQKIEFDPNGHIHAIHPRERLESHKLIEEFMILANVAAAQQLEAKQAPCLYRVHDQPSIEKIEAYRETLKGLGFTFPKSQAIKPKAFSYILEAAKESPHAALINELTLRTQSQALYQPENIGHFGLSLTRYSHFTSPIRRYADLIVHRSLISSLKLGSDGLVGSENLYDIGDHISTTERRAASAERAATERYITIFLKEHVGKIFKGRVTGALPFGLFVRLEDVGAEGVLPVSLLGDDFYQYDEKRHGFIGRRHKRTYIMGDTFDVRLVEVNPLTSSITVEPA